ncbi:MAG: hypothetical protein HRU27_12810 [Rhizobiaceae bacterium]|nr:hypothetical protein [Hyphomicrobiales bacterium]NRB31465.1 hypothetical protein [Rhizobiaceae bacterium]
MNSVLLLGSAPDAVRARDFDLSQFSAIVVLNNAWRIREDWTHIVYPEDFPEDRRPTETAGRQVIEYDQFVPANNAFGGIVYAGGTMAFTGGYWALDALQPDLLAFLGCDMVYEGDPAKSHFYGQGEPDPLRDDPTLQSLEAKSNRLRYMAFERDCICFNLSIKAQSRMTFERLDADLLSGSLEPIREMAKRRHVTAVNHTFVDQALAAEEQAGCYYPSGDYWNSEPPIDAAKLAQIDDLWLNVFN